MAMRKYGYNPRAARNEAVGQIAGDVQLLGLSLDEDTVRKWLSESASTIDIENL